MSIRALLNRVSLKGKERYLSRIIKYGSVSLFKILHFRVFFLAFCAFVFFALATSRAIGFRVSCVHALSAFCLCLV